MEKSKKKIMIPKQPMALGVLISLLVFIVFSLVDTLIYYFSKFEIKLSSTMFNFLSLGLLAVVVVFSVFKGKSLLGALLFLLTIIIDRGFVFIRNLIYGSISLSTFNDFYQFIAFAIMVFLVVMIILELKKGLPLVKAAFPLIYLLPLLVIGYNLIFIGYNSTLALILVFLLVFSFEEPDFIGWLVAAKFIFGFSNIIDFFVWKSNFEGYTESFGFWFNNTLIIALFVVGIIAIFKPNLFVLAKKETASEEVESEVEVIEE